MKFFRKKIFSFSIFLFILTSFQSCSWISKRKSLLDDDSAQKTPSSAVSSKDVVTKAQYDQLQGKYEKLLDKIKNAETKSIQNNNDSTKTKKIIAQRDLLNQLSKINPSADLAETVDVFGKNGLVSKSTPSEEIGKPPVAAKMSDDAVQRQLTQLDKANKLVNENKIDSALILLKELEESDNKFIKVRAKFYLAEMLFRQNEYDLALQMYEEIIQKYAFSGLVIKSLGRLIVCSEKLKLKKKQERYYSILHDFFES